MGNLDEFRESLDKMWIERLNEYSKKTNEELEKIMRKLGLSEIERIMFKAIELEVYAEYRDLIAKLMDIKKTISKENIKELLKLVRNGQENDFLANLTLVQIDKLIESIEEKYIDKMKLPNEDNKSQFKLNGDFESNRDNVDYYADENNFDFDPEDLYDDFGPHDFYDYEGSKSDVSDNDDYTNEFLNVTNPIDRELLKLLYEARMDRQQGLDR